MVENSDILHEADLLEEFPGLQLCSADTRPDCYALYELPDGRRAIICDYLNGKLAEELGWIDAGPFNF